jgi:hypothetical protein
MQDARLVELPELSGAVLDNHAQAIADLLIQTVSSQDR